MHDIPDDRDRARVEAALDGLTLRMSHATLLFREGREQEAISEFSTLGLALHLLGVPQAGWTRTASILEDLLLLHACPNPLTDADLAPEPEPAPETLAAVEVTRG